MIALLAAAASLLQSPGFAVATARVEITPPQALPLGGYTERLGRLFEPGGDPLYARTLLIRSGSRTIAMVSAELLTIPDSLRREVAQRLPSGVDLFLSATHTHCAPDSQMLNDRMTFAVPGIAKFDPKWLDWYSERIAASVQMASAAKASASEGPQLLEVHLDLNRPRRPGALPDKLATIVTFPPEFGFVHYAAHPVFYGAEENRLRSDWPGALAELGLVLLGPIGGVSPHPFADGIPEHRIRGFEMEFKTQFAVRLGQTVTLPSSPVAFVTQPIALGKPTPHPTFAKAYGVEPVAAALVVSRFAPPSANVTALRIGKLAVVGIPGEPSSHLGRRIRDAGRRLGFRSCLVVSHVNGWMGYILDATDYRQGGYEATLSFNGEAQGDRVVEAAIGALKQLAKPTSPR